MNINSGQILFQVFGFGFKIFIVILRWKVIILFLKGGKKIIYGCLNFLIMLENCKVEVGLKFEFGVKFGRCNWDVVSILYFFGVIFMVSRK